MTSKENLIVVAIEECSELAKALTKFMRFGVGAERNNEQDIWIEYFQLKKMMQMLVDNQILNLCPDDIATMIMESKEKNVKSYEKYSRKIGQIID